MKIQYRFISILTLLLPVLLFAQGPDRPEILMVSVDTASNYPVVYWKSNSDTLTDYYDIFYTDESFIGRVPHTNAPIHTYTDYNGLTSYKHEQYRVQALENGGIQSSFSIKLSSLLLKAKIDTCKKEVNLTWSSASQLFNGTTQGFEVLRKENNGVAMSLSTLASDLYSYTDKTIELGNNYTYLIKAKKENDTLELFSNKYNISSFVTPWPKYISGKEIVSLSDEIEVSFSIDSQFQTPYFKLLRSDLATGPFDTIAYFSDISDPLFSYIDKDVSPGKQAYYYKLEAYNNCLVKTTTSTVFASIYLQAQASESFATIFWDSYSWWDGETEKYILSRTPKDMDVDLLKTDNQYIDNLDVFRFDDTETLSGEFCYTLRAFEDDSNPYGSKGMVVSNQNCVQIESDFVIANAFNPSSSIEENRSFKPYFSFTPADYSFSVFDRWGKKVFETENIDEAWDGKNKLNIESPQGVYVYTIKYKKVNGNKVSKQGTVTLVYN